MPDVVDHARGEYAGREISNLLEQVDELLRPVPGVEEFEERIEKAKQLMTAPAFLAAGEPCDFASPAISIVLPTRNRAAFVTEAIASVQQQSFADWELIIVDDGSSDGTDQVVAGLLAEQRIQYVVQDFSGHSAARNQGLRLARGVFVAYLDSDNLWYPNFLKAALIFLLSDRKVDCVYGALVTEAHLAPPRTVLFDEFDRARLLQKNFIDLNTIVHRRALMDTYGGFDEDLDRLVDWDLLLRFTRDKPACRIPILAARYRVVDDQRVTATRPLARNLEAIQRKWRAGIA
jgi:glycosyltransferase involved in cell wall biosynthesis